MCTYEVSPKQQALYIAFGTFICESVGITQPDGFSRSVLIRSSMREGGGERERERENWGWSESERGLGMKWERTGD